MSYMYVCEQFNAEGYSAGAVEEKLPIVLEPFGKKLVCGVNTKEDAAELGLVDVEPQLEFNGLMGNLAWKLIPHVDH